jgi:hypothetical protein
MHANVTTFRRRPERLNEVGLDDIASIVHRLVGYQGAYVLVDRGSGLQLTITLWDTEESMNAAIAELQPIREQRARELDDTAPQAVERSKLSPGTGPTSSRACCSRRDGVDVLELPSRLGDREVSLDGGLVEITLSSPCRDLSVDGGEVRQTSIDALAEQDSQLAFSDAQPTAVFGRVMELQLSRQSSRFGCWVGGIQRGHGVGVQVVQHHPNDARVAIRFVH